MTQAEDVFLRIRYKANLSAVFKVVKGCFLKVGTQRMTSWQAICGHFFIRHFTCMDTGAAFLTAFSAAS